MLRLDCEQCDTGELGGIRGGFYSGALDLVWEFRESCSEEAAAAAGPEEEELIW